MVKPNPHIEWYGDFLSLGHFFNLSLSSARSGIFLPFVCISGSSSLLPHDALSRPPYSVVIASKTQNFRLTTPLQKLKKNNATVSAM
jgi:hypothetical protein